MSTDIYANFISEQVHKEKVRGIRDIEITEELELTSEDYINMLHMYIEALEGHFEAKDLQEISDTLRQNYVKKSKADLNKNWKKAG
jgi:hypothetical protein